jgi:hypothetical protein
LVRYRLNHIIQTLIAAADESAFPTGTTKQ